jgi:hypothetical protein
MLVSLAGAAAMFATAAGAYVYWLGPPPLGKTLDYSHIVLDREGRLLRAYATPDGRWRLPATAKDVDPRLYGCCSPTRISASTLRRRSASLAGQDFNIFLIDIVPADPL